MSKIVTVKLKLEQARQLTSLLGRQRVVDLPSESAVFLHTLHTALSFVDAGETIDTTNLPTRGLRS